MVGGMLAQLLWSHRVARLYARQKVRAVSAQRALVLPLAYRLSRKTGAVFAYNAHELETEILGFAGLKQRIFKFVERRYIKHADVVSVVNDSIADWYQNEYPGLPRPVVLTNTPIDNGGSVDLRSELSIPDDELLYVHVWYITHGRNVPLILRAFAATPKAHVVFLGDGSLRQSVVEAAKQHPNIHWHPMVSPDSVVSYVRGADIGLCLIEYASLSDELSTPNKLLESWVAGIPPLSSGLPEARRLLGPEASEIWVLDSPEEQLGEALERITAADVVEFKKHWKPVPSWDSQAVDLVEAYRAANERKR
jgi:glycosyltransferase involved in cell wall biosynthesis